MPYHKTSIHVKYHDTIEVLRYFILLAFEIKYLNIHVVFTVLASIISSGKEFQGFKIYFYKKYDVHLDKVTAGLLRSSWLCLRLQVLSHDKCLILILKFNYFWSCN